jgi:hypothetical protein
MKSIPTGYELHGLLLPQWCPNGCLIETRDGEVNTLGQHYSQFIKMASLGQAKKNIPCPQASQMGFPGRYLLSWVIQWVLWPLTPDIWRIFSTCWAPGALNFINKTSQWKRLKTLGTLEGHSSTAILAHFTLFLISPYFSLKFEYLMGIR